MGIGGLERVNRVSVVVATALSLVVMVASCQSAPTVPAAKPTERPAAPVRPTATLPATATAQPAPRFAATAGPPLPPVSDVEAVSLMRQTALRYGARPESVRVSVSDDPRAVTVRFASRHSTDQGPFELQRILITMAVARIAVRMAPSPEGGLSVGVIPAGGGDVGLVLTLVDGDVLARWAAGEFSDPQFVDQWAIGEMTRE